MNILQKMIVSAIIPISLLSQTISLDKDISKVELKNNSINLLVFPFVIHEAKLSAENPEDFDIKSKNTSLVILPTASNLKQSADLVVWSALGNAYLLKINSAGKEQRFTFSSNKIKKETPIEARAFETGKVESDIKKLVKKSVLGEKIPGYKKVEVKKAFDTPDLTLQKEFFYDGGKYRVETWFLSNKTSDLLTLDYENFYATGILSITFEKKVLKPNEVSKMWVIVNKSSLEKQIKRKNGGK